MPGAQAAVEHQGQVVVRELELRARPPALREGGEGVQVDSVGVDAGRARARPELLDIAEQRAGDHGDQGRTREGAPPGLPDALTDRGAAIALLLSVQRRVDLEAVGNAVLLGPGRDGAGPEGEALVDRVQGTRLLEARDGRGRVRLLHPQDLGSLARERLAEARHVDRGALLPAGPDARVLVHEGDPHP